MRSPVSHPEPSEATNTATVATSSGCRKRPSGVFETTCISKSVLAKRAVLAAARFSAAIVNWQAVQAAVIRDRQFRSLTSAVRF